MGRVQEGVRRTTECRARGEGTREQRLFDMSASEVTLLFCPSRGAEQGGEDGGEGKDEAPIMMP